MTYRSVKFDGTAAIVCGRGAPMRCHACHLAGGFRCDWIVGDRKTERPKRCDRPICPDHATQVGPNKHVCPEHREAWEAFRVARRESEEGG